MKTGTTAPAPQTVEAVSGRLADAATTGEALQRYPWPLPMRVAGYVVVCASVFSLLVHDAVYHRMSLAATFVLGGLFLALYHLASGQQARLRPRHRLWLLSTQVVCGVAMALMAGGNIAACLLLIFLAAELQFLAPFGVALAGSVVLWLITVGALEITVSWAGPVTLQGVLSDGASALCGFVFAAAVTRSAVAEVIQRHQATILFEELTATHARLRTYVDSVEALTVARERNRMARDIHDTLGHYLTVINVQIETAQKLSTRDAARSQAALTTAKRLASDCLAEVRRSVEALRPAALDGVALPEALARLVDDLRRASGVTIHVEGQGVGTLAPAAEVSVYRVIQEALTNVRKHAQARNVWLRTEWGPVWFSASVRDDGRGAPSQPISSMPAAGFGVSGMRERAAAVGGTLEVQTAPGTGFCVTLRVPCTPLTPGEGAVPRRAQEVRAP